jgi:carbonic anhydrase
MRIHNLYEDEQGESHWRDVEVEWAQTTPTGHLSAPINVSALIFRDTNPDYDLDWHPAPRRQYIINLDGGVKLTASDGESRVIGAGEVILVEDVSGKGHLSQNVEGKLRHSIFVPIDPV